MIFGISLLEDVPLSYGLDDSIEPIGKYLFPQVKAFLETNQKFESIPITDLNTNAFRRLRILRHNTEEDEESGERAKALTLAESLYECLVTLNKRYPGILT